MTMIAPSNALRWVVKAHLDDNTCEPCRLNDKKLYRNRQAAWRDYPNGKGYKKCVGAQYGNSCRCTVTKRGKEGSNVRDLNFLINRARALSVGMSARAHTPIRPDAAPMLVKTEPFRMEAADAGTTLYLYDAIGGWDGVSAMQVAQALTGVTGPITLRINSPGGFIFEGVAIHTLLSGYQGGPITSMIDGYAASAASFIALAASPYDAATDTGGIRMAESAFMMLHDGQGGAMGTADDLRDMADLLDMLSDTIANLYAKKTGGDATAWRETMQDGDTWYAAQAAIDAGLADVITTTPGNKAPAMRQPEMITTPALEPDIEPTTDTVGELFNALKGVFL